VLKLEVAALYFLACIFTAVALMPVLHIPVAAHLVPAGLFLLFVLAWGYKMARDPKMPVDNTPDECWRLGSIYNNPNDPAIFVQKRIGFGYTFNFGNPVSWIMLGVFALVGITFIFVLRR
jgi:uncharacterized membrane protein